MGDIADGILDGDFCEVCGDWLEDDGPGYPRKCEACSEDN